MNTIDENKKLPSRESETREKTSRRKPWTPPSQLDAPPAPAGFTHRWIRAESVGQQDQKNVSARLRVIAVGGLMLARIPNETVAERTHYFTQKTKDRDNAIANDPLKDQHPSMPVSNASRSQVSFGGKKS